MGNFPTVARTVTINQLNDAWENKRKNEHLLGMLLIKCAEEIGLQRFEALLNSDKLAFSHIIASEMMKNAIIKPYRRRKRG